MLDLFIERIGHLGLVECQGRIVRSEAAFKLRRAVMSLRDSRLIVLDLSEVAALEGGGLGMIVFLERWAHDKGIPLRVFNPRMAVRARLELIRSIQPINAVSLQEMMTMLANANSDIAVAA
jgi:anti-anti-sigma regulatory factor